MEYSQFVSTPLLPKGVVHLHKDSLNSMRRRLPFQIVFEDRDLVVIDKPAGLLSTHTRLAGRRAREEQPTAENYLNDYLRKGQAKSRLRVWLVHRLDRETSGVMMFAKSEEVAERFRANWNRLTEKKYLAYVEGVMVDEGGIFESWLKEDPDGYRVRSVPEGTPGARLARTEWRVLKPLPASPAGDFHPFSGDCPRIAATLVEVVLKSGRKNQIRVHFSEAGHPVAGDVKYGARPASRLFLHSASLSFVHPRTGKKMTFTSATSFAK